MGFEKKDPDARPGGAKKSFRGFSATQVLVLGFFLVIVFGAFLLHFPFAARSREWTPLLKCFFTAVSATCVTGLIVVDTATHWSLFGQIVILLMIQTGGLGFMTFAVSLARLARRKISPRERVILASSYNLNTFEDLLPLLRRILIGTACIEGGGALLLMIRFIPLFGVGQGIWKSVFHSVSAFCNAGFDLMGSVSGPFSSMTMFAEDVLVSLTLSALIALGGIGFVVWNDLYDWFRTRDPISVYTKAVAAVSAVLWLIGFLAVALCEWTNPETIGTMSVPHKLVASLFQSVTFRTAGFNTIALEKMHPAAQFVSLFLMFVGGASGSTAGGVKVVTIGIVFVALVRYARGNKHVSFFYRTIPEEDVLRAFTVVTFQLFVTVLGALSMIACGVSLMPALFEAFSASATVGLSLGLTPTLPAGLHVVIMFMMYFGRVGLLTVTTAFQGKTVDEENQLRYADVHMLIG